MRGIIASARGNSFVPPPVGTPMQFGYTATVGTGDGFPGSADRALTSKFVKSNAGRVTQINARFRPDTVAGANGKVVCHADGAVPGTLLWISQPLAIPAGGGIVTFGLPSSGIENTDPAGSYWLLFVPDNFQANLAKSNSAIDGTLFMANGTYSYASPPSTWPGTTTTYDGPGCMWCDYLGV